jgi:hypothetical protein
MDREKLGKLLDHWIEHSTDHTQKYLDWAEDLKYSDPGIAQCLMDAVEHFQSGERSLREARERL